MIPALALLVGVGRRPARWAPIERSLSLGLLALPRNPPSWPELLLQRHTVFWHIKACSANRGSSRQALACTPCWPRPWSPRCWHDVCSLLLLLWRRQGAI